MNVRACVRACVRVCVCACVRQRNNIQIIVRRQNVTTNPPEHVYELPVD